MKIFSKKNKLWDKPFSEKISNRIKKVSTADLEMYVEQSIYDISRTMSGYRRGKEQVYLDEALLAAEVLHALVNEIALRTTKP